MKKTLVLIALVCIVALTNAQKISFVYNNRAVAQGDTITVVATSEQIQDGTLGVSMFLRNNTSNTLSGHKAKCVPIDGSAELTVSSICFGECKPGNLSPEFSLNANSTSDKVFLLDFAIPSNAHDIQNLFKLSAGDNASDYDNSAVIYINAIVSATAIAEATPATVLKAYPNPASNMVAIDYSLPEDGTLVVCNLLGCVVKTVALNAGEGTVRLGVTDLPKGIYAYGVQGRAMHKLVVR